MDAYQALLDGIGDYRAVPKAKEALARIEASADVAGLRAAEFDFAQRLELEPLTLTAADRKNIADMLAFSSNTAADALWAKYGREALTTRMKSTYGMTNLTFVNGFPRTWGFIKYTAQDLANLSSYVLDKLNPDDQLATVKGQLSAAGESLRLTRQRKEFGVGNVLENIQAEEDLTRARNDYIAAIAEYDKAQYRLRYAAGASPALPPQ